MPILKIEKLTKKYGKTYALNGLDMEVKKGDIYGFVGPNGAGKTTTLRIISGLLKSDGGDLWLDGVRTTKNILKQKSLIGFVPDFFGVYENLSVIEYLEFFAASYGIYGRAGTVRAREVLEMVELSGKEEQMVDSLSRGIQQRLCLARAMIHKPKLLVLDEPNSGLDPRSRKDFQLLLQRLAREDYTILISSHILSELADLCTSIGVINGGVMVQQGKLENIMLAIDRRWNYCGRIRRSAAFLWMKTRLRPGFREAGRRRRICCRNWWMPESLWFHLHGNTTAWSPCSSI